MGYEFEIDLKRNMEPIYCLMHKLSPLDFQQTNAHVDSMLEHGFMLLSQFPHVDQVVSVPKKDSILHFCVDWNWLNERTIHNYYDFPLWEEMMQCLLGIQAFNKLIYIRDIGICQNTRNMCLRPLFQCFGF